MTKTRKWHALLEADRSYFQTANCFINQPSYTKLRQYRTNDWCQLSTFKSFKVRCTNQVKVMYICVNYVQKLMTAANCLYICLRIETRGHFFSAWISTSIVWRNTALLRCSEKIVSRKDFLREQKLKCRSIWRSSWFWKASCLVEWSLDIYKFEI